MIRPKLISILVLLCVATVLLLSTAVANAQHFSVKEYDTFHDVLHPLEHEALPAKDFARIRSNSAALVQRGKAMVKLGVPSGTDQKYVEEFRKELKKFKKALNQLSKDAKSGSDGSLETSFSAVHDSFEMLVGMLPRK